MLFEQHADLLAGKQVRNCRNVLKGRLAMEGSLPVTLCNRLMRVIRQFSLMLGAFTLLSACRPAFFFNDTSISEIYTINYDLIIPAKQDLSRSSGNTLLILFPCFNCDAADTQEESAIPEAAAANGIAVLMMNYNRHLLMSGAEQEQGISMIAGAVKEHGVDASNTFIGGFSSGGNVGVLIAKALLKSTDAPVQVKGVFAVDSPLDLSHLYQASKHRLERPSFPAQKGEARMVVALLDSTLGDPATNGPAYEAASPLMDTETSIAPLVDLPVRFYTEPDTTWWRQNRGDSYEDMNAFALKRLHGALLAAGNLNAEYITTEGRGFQHGRRHPHAWSIVDEQELVRWINKLSKEH